MKTGSLKRHITLLSMLPCLIIGMTLAAISTVSQVFDHHDFRNQRGNTASLQLAQLAASRLDQQDWLSLQELSNTFLQEPDVSGVAFYDKNQQVLIGSGQLQAKLPLEQLLSLRPQSKKLNGSHVFAHPIQGNHLVTNIMSGSTEPQAWVVIEYQQQALLQQLYRNLIFSALVILFGLAACVFFTFRVHKQVQSQLQNLTEGLARIRLGDKSYELEVEKHSDFRHLSYEINNMTSSLRDEFAELQETQKNSASDLRKTVETIEIQSIELDIARKEAIQTSRVKSEFLANTSHEIRTPLNGIMGYARLLEKSELSLQQREYLNTISQSSQSLLHIINDILDFSKIEAGKLVLDHIEFDIRAAVDEVCALLAPTAHEKNLDLVQLIAPDVPAYIVSDPLRLKQILSNLISNAIKFTQHGSICINVNIESKQQLRFDVIDTGIGLSEEQKSKIFNTFAQADSSTSREFGGTGLGLVIAKSLTKQMGGDIAVESEIGQGSKFWFSMQFQASQHTLKPKPDLVSSKVAIIEANTKHRQSLSNYSQIHALNYHLFDDIEAFSQLPQLHKESYEHIIYCLDSSLDDSEKPELERQTQQLSQLPAERHYLTMLSEQIDLLPQDEQARAQVKPCGYKKLESMLLAQNDCHNQQLQRRFDKPLAVMAVDDNPSNLKLIETLLCDMGLDVCCLNSGLKALKEIEKNDFDIIFMDIQMPELDGVETTQKIRALANHKATIPVIAVTAHALQEEKQRLLAAGLNAYITKPIDEAQLFELILDWTDAQVAADMFEPMTAVSAHANNDKTNQNMNKPVSIKQCLSLAKNKSSLAQELLTMLIDDLLKDQSLIQSDYRAQDWPSLLKRVHKLHGACCYTGVDNLREACSQVESLLKREHYLQLDVAMQALETQIKALLDWQEEVDIEILFAE